MHGFKKRIEKLEGSDTEERSHVVLWGDGQPFADALGLRQCHPDATKRVLIRLQGVSGGRGGPVVDKRDDPKYMAEYAKAEAWVKGSPNSRIAGA
jgi:hypothetical protein